MTETDAELIERLLDEFLERIRRGETAAIAEYEALHPRHAASIRELFSAAEMMERMAQRRQRERGPSVLPAKIADRLGDYRIVREIGRGGMGIVFEAEQESLCRRVAVKVLPQSSLLKPQSLRRFERESRTAARLHHTNIIPVFGVGEHEGLHYIVMQLIRGVGLDKILLQLARDCSRPTAIIEGTAAASVDDATSVARALLRGEFHRPGSLTASSDADTEELPQQRATPPSASQVVAAGPAAETVSFDVPAELGRPYWESVARIGIQAAQALQYAHERGTLHRDIKPANLLVDMQGIVWVGDFGLAKSREHDEASQTGDIAGTLRYMAPERFHGEVDARSDIYGLGLSLYELLTLQPAYEDSHPSSLMRRIARETPAHPRDLNPQVPLDLETIVLKAIAREPAHRYGSAREMADDLQRFLEDRPILARRVGVVERLWRWSRRNRMVAALIGLASGLLVLLAIVSTAGYVTTNIANRQVRSALFREARERRAAESQQRKADAVSELASAALDDLFEQFMPTSIVSGSDAAAYGSLDGEIRVPVQPMLSKEVASLLERMLTYYDRLAEIDANDDVIGRKVAEANRRVGDIRRRLGDFEQAQAAYRRAIEKYRHLAQESPFDASLDGEIAGICNDLGSLHWTARWEEEGYPLHRKALDVLTATDRAAEGALPLRYELARTYFFLGRGGPPDASYGRERPDTRDRRPSSSPAPKPREGAPAERDRTGKPDTPPPLRTRDNENYLQLAIRLLETLVSEQPTVPEYQHLLACCYRDLPPRRDTDAQASSGPQDKAIEILAKLAGDHPEVPDYRYDLSKAYAKIDPHDPHFSEGQFSNAENRLRQATVILRQLVAEHPNAPDYTASEAQALYTLSEVLHRMHRSDDAEKTITQALELQTSLAAQYPDAVPYQVWKAILQDSLARRMADRGDADRARAILETSIADLRHLLQRHPQATYIQAILERSQTSLANVSRASDDNHANAVER
jgi:serine/threonine protein kinase